MALAFPPSIRVLLGVLKSPTTTETHVVALKRLNASVSASWFELAEKLPQIELYYEESTGENKQLAALLLSHIHFHLEQLQYAMKFSLLAGEAFLTLFQNLYGQQPSDYPEAARQFVDVIVGSVIDHFISVCGRSWENANGLKSSEDLIAEEEGLPALFPQVERFVSVIVGTHKPTAGGSARVLSPQALKMLLGIALDAYKIDLVRQILQPGQESSFTLIQYVVDNANLLIATKHFRKTVFGVVAELYAEFFQPLLTLAHEEVPKEMADSGRPVFYQAFEELPRYCEVLFNLDDAECVAVLLRALIHADVLSNDPQKKHYLWALQLAFDLTSFGSQSFLSRIRSSNMLATKEQSDEMKSTDTSPDVSAKLKVIQQVLLGDSEISIELKFSHQENATDLEIADAVKNGLDSKHQVLHTSLVVAHGLMQRGTTCDVFLRKNLDWFGRSTCWGKFSATASLGVVHQTHAEKSFRVLSTYLPGLPGSNTTQQPSSSFSDGGSLYALGLIHANRSDSTVISYLLEQLSVGSGMAGGQMNQGSASTTVNEISQHGASLGLGLAAMGSQNPALYEALRSVLMMDSAVSGESSALGIGLVMLGSGSEEVIEDLLQYAKDTRHEKIIRACSLAIALVCFKCEEEAIDVATRMMTDSDPLIRYGGCFALGLAHCATGRESAIRSLLHVAVSDSSNDVRRAAVLAISYVLCNIPEQTPRVLKLLSDSFNFHVRYAATLAIGISCAGTASPEALAALVPATRDSTDVVRQAAFMSLGLVLMECTDKQLEEVAAKSAATVKSSKARADKEKETRTKEATTERARQHAKNADSGLPAIPTPSEVRDHLIAVSTDRREDVMARVGAIIGLGLLEAGGRNVTASFFSNRGLLRREAVVGFVLFSQYWFWYPLLLTVSLTLRPTALIGLTADLKCPKSFKLECDGPASHYAYASQYKPKKKEAPTQGVFALLSAAQRRTGAKPQNAHIETKATPEPTIEEKPEEAPVPEEPTHVIPNMSRMLPGQCARVRLPENSRYVPICAGRERRDGIVILVDTRPEESEEYHEAGGSTPPAIDSKLVEESANDDEDEAPVPEPFELD